MDIEILEEPPAIFQTPSRRRTKKVKEKLDDNFLRHNRRLSKKNDGFKDVKSDRKNKEAAQSEAIDEEEVAKPTALAITPGPSNNGAAPHLSKEIMEGIATGVL